MKRLPLLLLGLSLLAAPAFAQAPTPAPSPAIEAKAGLTKFDLSFPGGTPGELVAAIEKAMGKPLNAIIPEEHAKRRLPPLKMSRVDVAQLFDALLQASFIPKATGGLQWNIQAGFFTTNRANVSDDTVWYFGVQGAPPANLEAQVKLCRVYLLTPYLDSGLTVDDITTAIRTSWKMIGDLEVPQSLTFHQETKLLIAAADERSLKALEEVLTALKHGLADRGKANEKKPSKS